MLSICGSITEDYACRIFNSDKAAAEGCLFGQVAVCCWSGDTVTVWSCGCWRYKTVEKIRVTSNALVRTIHRSVVRVMATQQLRWATASLASFVYQKSAGRICGRCQWTGGIGSPARDEVVLVPLRRLNGTMMQCVSHAEPCPHGIYGRRLVLMAISKPFRSR